LWLKLVAYFLSWTWVGSWLTRKHYGGIKILLTQKPSSLFWLSKKSILMRQKKLRCLLMTSIVVGKSHPKWSNLSCPTQSTGFVPCRKISE
jgi:hypothetical protein